MTNETKLSDAMTVLKAMWDSSKDVNPYSEIRLRSSMVDTLELLIKANVKFDIEDFSKLHDNFHFGSGYYVTSFLGRDEHYYNIAVAVENISACKSFEYGVNRKPFITDNVITCDYNYAGHCSGFNQKLRSRLSIGCKFIYKGEKVHVTSFAKDNSYLCAVTYKSRDKQPPCPTCNMGGGWGIGELKINHLYKITHNDLKESQKIEVKNENM
jgi:hypothetical protein